MTSLDLNEDFARRVKIFKSMLDDGEIDITLFNKLMEQARDETFFALEVLETIEAL